MTKNMVTWVEPSRGLTEIENYSLAESKSTIPINLFKNLKNKSIDLREIRFYGGEKEK